MSLDTREIARILQLVEDSPWDELSLDTGETTLFISKTGTAAEPELAAAPALPLGAAGVACIVESPSIGIFRGAESPDAQPLAEPGIRTEVGATLGFVAVMATLEPVTSPVAGVVTAVHVADGDVVEYGSALVTVQPDQA